MLLGDHFGEAIQVAPGHDTLAAFASHFHGELSFTPHLPAGWSELEFSLRFRDRQLRITLTPEADTFRIVEGEPLDITVRGVGHRLTADEPLVLTGS